MQTENIKEKAQKLLDNLPDLATWEDLMYRIYVREAIEAGIKDSDQGRTVDVKEVRRRFGLSCRYEGLLDAKRIKHLTNIYDYIALNSPTYARRMVDRITRRSEQISTQPLSGRKVPE